MKILFVLLCALALGSSVSFAHSPSDAVDAQACIDNQMTVTLNQSGQSSKDDLLSALQIIGDCGCAYPISISTSGSERILSVSFERSDTGTISSILSQLNQLSGVSASCKTQGGSVHGAVSGSN